MSSKSNIEIDTLSSVSFQRTTTLPEAKPTTAKELSLSSGKQNIFEAIFLAKDSYLSGTFNLANTTIGAGVLLLPYVFKEAGIILGILLMIAGAILSSITLHIIAKVWLKVQQFDSKCVDYEDLGDFLFGKWMGFFVKLSVIIINFGACISYLILINHLVTPVILGIVNESTAEVLHDSSVFSAFITIIFSIPSIFLSCIPSIGDLRFISYISLSSMLVFISMVFVGLLSGYTSDRRVGSIKWFVVSWESVPLLGIVTLAFACHTNMCSVVREFGVQKGHRATTAVVGNSITCFVTFVLIGICGYLSFLDNTCSDIVQSYPSKSSIDVILRCILTFSLILTYPMSSYPARVSIRNFTNDLLHPKKLFHDSIKCCEGARIMKNHKPQNDVIDIFPKNLSDSDSEEELSDDLASVAGVTFPRRKGLISKIKWYFQLIKSTQLKEYPKALYRSFKRNIRNIIEGVFIGVLSLIIAIAFPFASVLFSLVGSTGSTMATFIFPSLYYYVTFRPSWKNPILYLLMFLFVFGLVFGVVVTSVNFYQIVTGQAQTRDICNIITK